MTRHGITRRALAATTAIALLGISAGAAFADGDDELDEDRIIRQREILMANNGEVVEGNGWLGSNLHFHSTAGFAYSRELKMGERPLFFGLKGPVLKKHRALGLTFRLRF